MAKYRVYATSRSFGDNDHSIYEYMADRDCDLIKIKAEEIADVIEDADAVIAGLEVYDRSLLDKAGKLKVISRYGVGYDRVDLDTAREKGIKVTITPGANGDSVADMACALILACARNIPIMNEKHHENNYYRPAGVELDGKTLGIIGAGRIGKGVARRLSGFNMKILCYDQYEDQEFAAAYKARYVTLEELVKSADYITIHSPLTDETQNMISTEQFNMMKKDAIIVNTARGGIIDEQALYHALKDNRIRSAGLDVMECEPSYDSPLNELENCIITPHAAAATIEAGIKMSKMACDNVLDVLYEGSCKYEV